MCALQFAHNPQACRFKTSSQRIKRAFVASQCSQMTWMWFFQKKIWLPMDEATMQVLNAALSQAPPHSEVTFTQWYKPGAKWQSQEYTANFIKMTQRNHDSGCVRNIKAVWQTDESKEFSWGGHLDSNTLPALPGPPAPPPQGQGNLADDSSANQAWVSAPQDPNAASFPTGSQPSRVDQWKDYNKPEVVPQVGDGKSSDTTSAWENTNKEDYNGSWCKWAKLQ